jgi:hypothetical protein
VDELDEVERVAAGLLQQPRQDSVGVTTEEVCGDRDRRISVEGAQADADRAGIGQPGQRGLQGRRRGAGAAGQQPKDRDGEQCGGEPGEQEQGRVVCPLQVVDGDGQRVARRLSLKGGAQELLDLPRVAGRP